MKEIQASDMMPAMPKETRALRYHHYASSLYVRGFITEKEFFRITAALVKWIKEEPSTPKPRKRK